jgi:hypothetical protein
VLIADPRLSLAGKRSCSFGHKENRSGRSPVSAVPGLQRSDGRTGSVRVQVPQDLELGLKRSNLPIEPSRTRQGCQTISASGLLQRYLRSFREASINSSKRRRLTITLTETLQSHWILGDSTQRCLSGVAISMKFACIVSVAMLGELQVVEKKINGGNPAVPGNDEISTSVCWRLTRAAR